MVWHEIGTADVLACGLVSGLTGERAGGRMGAWAVGGRELVLGEITSGGIVHDLCMCVCACFCAQGEYAEMCT